MPDPTVAFSLGANVVFIGCGLIYKWIKTAPELATLQFWSNLPAAPHETSSTLLQWREPPPLPPRQDRISTEKRDVAVLHSPRFKDSFTYPRLSDQRPEIRLLKIFQAHSSLEPVSCQLEVVSINTDIKYTALSYRWGSMGSEIILVNGRQFLPSENMRNALLELRSRGVEYAWIDQICIDQGHHNNEEKIQQIQHMPAIYSRADLVVAWLGMPDEEMQQLHETFSKLLDLSRRANDTEQKLHWWQRSKGFNKNSESILFDLLSIWIKESQIPERRYAIQTRLRKHHAIICDLLDNSQLSEGDRDLHARQQMFYKQLEAFVQRDYWCRAWIVQELTVSSIVEIWCGALTFDYDLAFDVLNELHCLWTDTLHQDVSGPLLQIISMSRLRSIWRSGRAINLLEALFSTPRVKCSLEHDRIYALLGISFNKLRFVTAIDYHQDVETLIRKMTEYSIRATRSLDVICLRSSVEEVQHSLPSWTPDWRNIGIDNFNSRMVKYLSGTSDYPELSERSRIWQATGNSQYKNVQIHHNVLLHVNAFVLNKVLRLTSAVNGNAANNTDQASSIQQVHIPGFDLIRVAETVFETFTVYKPKSPVHDNNARFSYIWQPDVLKKLQETDPAVAQWLVSHQSYELLGKSLGEWSSYKSRHRDIIKSVTTKGLRLAYDLMYNDKNFIFDGDYQKNSIVSSIQRLLKDGMRLFEAAGGWMGWAHPATCPDDWIALVEGCSMPVVLREYPHSLDGCPIFRIIGDAYVTNEMQGSLWKSKASKELERIILI